MHPVGVRQTWTLVLFISATVIAVPLISYKTSDPGWMSAVHPAEPVRNIFGPNGAWFADLCYSLFGYFAFFLPLVCLCAGVAQLFGRSAYLKWRLPLAFVLVWCSGTLLCSLHFTNFIPLPVSTGGMLGVRIAALTMPHLPLEILTLLALFLFAWGAGLMFGFSWMRIAEGCGSVFVFLFQRLGIAPRPAVTPQVDAYPEQVEGDGETSDRVSQPEQTKDKPGLFRTLHALGATLFDASPKHTRRIEPSLGDLDAPAPHRTDATDTSDGAIRYLTEDDPVEGEKATKTASATSDGEPPLHYQSRLDLVQHLRKAYTEEIGELSPELQSTLEQIQQEEQEKEKEKETAKQDANQEAMPKEGASGDAPANQDSAVSEPGQSERTIASMSEQSPGKQGSRVVFDPPGEEMDFPDPEDEENWSDFSDLSLDDYTTGEGSDKDLDFTLAEEAPKPDSPPETPSDVAALEGKPPTPLVELVQAKKVEYNLPGVALLTPSQKADQVEHDTQRLEEMGTQLEQNLLDFGIKADVEEIHPGPVITRFEITPAPGVKVVRVTNLVKDIARSMSVTAVRIVEVIPGKSTIGIEIPNTARAMVRLSQVIDTQIFRNSKAKLPLSLGYDIQGTPIVAPLEKMPHLLVAGTTGSGKSVGVNAMLLSLLYRLNPEQLRLLLIDPKMLELSVYNGIPHLLTPVITDMKDAANGLRWCVAEMERRYSLMSKMGVRNLDGYNTMIKQAEQPIRDPLQTDPDGNRALAPLPHVVVIIDEFADMMMIVGKKVEELIARIAQKARAAGIHLILATQRPSVDVITGLIKANIPTRIAFQVSSKIDSRTIIDQSGAEQLLGNGDMLFLPPGQGVPQRVHGAFVSDEEVHKLVDFWKEQDAPDYLTDITRDQGSHEHGDADHDEEEGIDELFDEAVNFILETQRVSISLLQRKFKIGYNRAARIIDSMEEQGIVSPMESNGKREIVQQTAQS